MEYIYIFILALLIDIIFAEFPNRFHPIAWLGKLINLELKIKPDEGRYKQIIYGAFMVLLTTAIITAGIFLMLNRITTINTTLFILIGAIILKLTFSLHGLIRAANLVRKQLMRNKIEDSRNSLKALVSRNTEGLNNNEIIAATIESLAENSCDSFIAPVFYFLLFGIPGAVAYRIINTFDAMIGYHGKWEYIGKFAARLDDMANFLPARITALLIVSSSFIIRKNSKQSWQIMLRDHNKTESPNAGWTMSAIAGALNVQLEKAGYYRLGNNTAELSVNTINSALYLLLILSSVWVFLVFTIKGALIIAG